MLLGFLSVPRRPFIDQPVQPGWSVPKPAKRHCNTLNTASNDDPIYRPSVRAAAGLIPRRYRVISREIGYRGKLSQA